jgi:hypothetical protein
VFGEAVPLPRHRDEGIPLGFILGNAGKPSTFFSTASVVFRCWHCWSLPLLMSRCIVIQNGKHEAIMSDRRELYRSPNGDSWFLGREPTNGRAFIIHQPNGPSGGRLSHVELGEFLRLGNGPEQQALLRLIGTLVEVPPYA